MTGSPGRPGPHSIWSSDKSVCSGKVEQKRARQPERDSSHIGTFSGSRTKEETDPYFCSLVFPKHTQKNEVPLKCFGEDGPNTIGNQVQSR